MTLQIGDSPCIPHLYNSNASLCTLPQDLPSVFMSISLCGLHDNQSVTQQPLLSIYHMPCAGTGVGLQLNKSHIIPALMELIVWRDRVHISPPIFRDKETKVK